MFVCACVCVCVCMCRSGGGCVCMKESVCAYKVCETVYQFACEAECLRAVNTSKCAIMCINISHIKKATINSSKK